MIRRTAMAVMIAAAGPATAQRRVIPITPGMPYTHQHSGLVIPATIDGLPRDRATAIAIEDLDDSLGFQKADQSEIVTIFVFRHVIGSVPVWFDQTARIIQRRADTYGDVTPAGVPMPVTPPHQRNASGLMQVFAATGGAFRSTGAVMLPLGPEWYVAIRYSSKTLTPDALRGHLTTVLEGLGWPTNVADQPVAVPMVACAIPLALTGQAQPIAAGSYNPVSLLMLGHLIGDPRVTKTDSDAVSGPMCRDDTAIVHGYPDIGVYHSDARADRYIMAFNDAGRGIWVGRDALSATLDKQAPPHWTATLLSVDYAEVMPPLDRLPSPDQVMSMIPGPRVGRVSTWGEKTQITLSAGAPK